MQRRIITVKVQKDILDIPLEPLLHHDFVNDLTRKRHMAILSFFREELLRIGSKKNNVTEAKHTTAERFVIGGQSFNSSIRPLLELLKSKAEREQAERAQQPPLPATDIRSKDDYVQLLPLIVRKLEVFEGKINENHQDLVRILQRQKEFGKAIRDVDYTQLTWLDRE